jgi:hypothetical protein
VVRHADVRLGTVEGERHGAGRPPEDDARGLSVLVPGNASATASTRSKATTLRLNAFEESRDWFSSSAINRAIRSVCAMAASIATRSRFASCPM